MISYLNVNYIYIYKFYPTLSKQLFTINITHIYFHLNLILLFTRIVRVILPQSE